MEAAVAGDAAVAEERKRQKQALVEPIKEAAYEVFLCLRTYRKTCRAFQSPDFFRGALGPFLCPHIFKTFRCDGDIKEAVALWCSDPAAAEEKYGHISKWDVSCVTNMRELFCDKRYFNDDISAWDVSSVTTMDWMFCRAFAFSQPIGGWNVSKVTTMKRMFWHATAFNQPIGNWNVSKVETTLGMFFNATTFNQPIGDWDVSKVKGMEYMFYHATSFNQPIGAWDVSNVENMRNILEGAVAFKQTFNQKEDEEEDSEDEEEEFPTELTNTTQQIVRDVNRCTGNITKVSKNRSPHI
jgi:surface protein